MKTKQLAVQCLGITKKYGTPDNEVTALRGIDLDVLAGELLIIAGPSGCGKTTLLSIIAGILDQSQGTCRVYDTDVSKMSSAEKIAFRAKNVGFVFQAYNLMPTLTSAENVSIPLIIGGMDRKEAAKKGGELLAEMGLADKANAYPTELSGGQQQRVAIARALIHDPRLIVCDEPTSALDGDTGHKIMELMKKMVLDKDRTLIVVTHDSRIFEFANRIAKMEDGHVVKIANSIKEFEE